MDVKMNQVFRASNIKDSEIRFTIQNENGIEILYDFVGSLVSVALKANISDPLEINYGFYREIGPARLASYTVTFEVGPSSGTNEILLVQQLPERKKEKEMWERTPDKWGDTWGQNPYYSPQLFGAKIVGEIDDPNASYSFDKVVVWADLDNTVQEANQEAASREG